MDLRVDFHKEILKNRGNFGKLRQLSGKTELSVQKKDAVILPGTTQPCSIAALLTNVMFYHY